MARDPFARAPVQRALKEQVERGRTVVANVHTHGRLVRWAIEHGRYVYIGRRPVDPAYRTAATASADYAWGTPYPCGPLPDDAERAAAIARYEGYLAGRPDLLARLPELRGKVLGCHCKPFACHGDVLARLADGQEGGAA